MVQGSRGSPYGGLGVENVHSPLYGTDDVKELFCVLPGQAFTVCLRVSFEGTKAAGHDLLEANLAIL